MFQTGDAKCKNSKVEMSLLYSRTRKTRCVLGKEPKGEAGDEVGEGSPPQAGLTEWLLGSCCAEQFVKGTGQEEAVTWVRK